MEYKTQQLLWRVTWIHRSGYPSPTYYVEAKRGKNEKECRKNAVKTAKTKSRLADFPKTWYCKVTDVTDYK